MLGVYMYYFGFLVQAMYNHTCVQVNELPQSRCGDKKEGKNS